MGALEILTFFYNNAITPAMVVAGVAWLFKTIVINSLGKESIALRGQIERDSAIAIEKVRSIFLIEVEQLRHSYNQELEEKKVRFARLQDKRLEPILRMYNVLSELSASVEHIQTLYRYETDDSDDMGSEVKGIEDLLLSAKTEFTKTQIFLPKAIANSVENFMQPIRDADLAYYMERADGGDSRKALIKYINCLRGDERKVMSEIADQVRNLLGVEEIQIDV